MPESVGTSIPRVDGEAKVRGAALYIDDLPARDALHGARVRSQVPHGFLRGIHRDPAFDWSGVVVVTAADMPAKNTIYFIEEDQPALVRIAGRIAHGDGP